MLKVMMKVIVRCDKDQVRVRTAMVLGFNPEHYG